jgi:UDP-N-acetylglucosamine 1-carboxyvinyltransferase
MDKLVIEGGHALRGSLPVSGSKNAALPLMAAALLAEGTTRLSGVPDLRDVRTFSNVIRVTGARVQHQPAQSIVAIDGRDLVHPEAPYELVKKMRASFYMLGALLGRCGEARVSMPGGCAWGPRPVDLHLKGLEALGATIDLEGGYVVASAPGGRLAGGSFAMEPSSVGATVNVLLGAVLARGGSRIENAAREPDVVVLCEALRAMGAKIDGVGTSVLEIEGVDRLDAVEFANAQDRIELGTYMIAAALAGVPGEPVTLTDAEPDHLGDAFTDAFEATGARATYDGDTVTVVPPEQIRAVSIETGIYPGFPTDLQAQWTVLMTQADGPSTVSDPVYTDRFKHIPELQRMGASIRMEGHTAHIQPTPRLSSAPVMSTDLRASVSLVMAGMVAEGETHVGRIYHLDRGYVRLEEKLAGAGLAVRRVQYDEFAAPEVPGV